MDAQKVHGGKRSGCGSRTKRRYGTRFRRPDGEQCALYERNRLNDRVPLTKREAKLAVTGTGRRGTLVVSLRDTVKEKAERAASLVAGAGQKKPETYTGSALVFCHATKYSIGKSRQRTYRPSGLHRGQVAAAPRLSHCDAERSLAARSSERT